MAQTYSYPGKTCSVSCLANQTGTGCGRVSDKARTVRVCSIWPEEVDRYSWARSVCDKDFKRCARSFVPYAYLLTFALFVTRTSSTEYLCHPTFDDVRHNTQAYKVTRSRI